MPPAPKLQPALLGGLAMGVLSALPLVGAANCCCAWILFGGGLAAYLMQQNHPAPITAGDGAIVGLLAGVFGAVIGAVLSVPVSLMMGPMQAAIFERILDNARDMPPEARALLESMRSNMLAAGVGMIAAFVAVLFLGLLVAPIFGAVGGVLGAVIFRKNVPPPPPPPPTPWGAPPIPETPATPWNPPPPPPPDVPGTV